MIGLGWNAAWRRRRAERIAKAAASEGPEECPRTVILTMAVTPQVAGALDRLTRDGLHGENSAETAHTLLLERLREVTGR